MNLKQKLKSVYEANKILFTIAVILNIVFSIIVLLSLFGVNIAELSCNNKFLMDMNLWFYKNNLHLMISGLMFASNIYFMIAISSNDYSGKPLLYIICLLPVCICLQYAPTVPRFIISCLLPICISLAYSFKFSTLWKSVLFLAITMIYQYSMMNTKLKIFGAAYVSADLLTYILLSIDLYVVFILYFCICKTIYKNKSKKEEV